MFRCRISVRLSGFPLFRRLLSRARTQRPIQSKTGCHVHLFLDPCLDFNDSALHGCSPAGKAHSFRDPRFCQDLAVCLRRRGRILDKADPALAAGTVPAAGSQNIFPLYLQCLQNTRALSCVLYPDPVSHSFFLLRQIYTCGFFLKNISLYKSCPRFACGGMPFSLQ